MKKLILLLLMASACYGMQRAQGYCEQGNKTVITGGDSGAPKVQASYPRCTVTVFVSGTVTLATIYSDNAQTALGNPFTATSTGLWFFYAANGHYDVRLSAGGIPAPFTIGDIFLNDTGYAPRAGTVMVYPPAIQNGVGTAVAPNGTLISCSGTTTSCLQEAENYRYQHGYDLHIVGGDEPTFSPPSPGPTGGAVVYQLTTTWALHPMEGTVVDSGAITLNWGSAIGSNPCMTVDSMIIATVKFPGSQIVCGGTGPALLFKPVNPVPQDYIFGIGIQMTFEIFTVVNTHSPSSAVANVPLIEFDSTGGPIAYSDFICNEPNGSGIAIKIDDPPSGMAFHDNKITGRFIHDQVGGTNPVVQIGQTATTRITDNQWDLFINSPNTGKAISTFELNGTYKIGTASGTNSYGIFFETGAAGNSVWASQLAGTTQQPNTYSIGGDCSLNRMLPSTSQVGSIEFPLTVGASPWTYQNTTCLPVTVVISGGTVSKIELGTTTGNFMDLGVTAGAFPLCTGCYLKTTYSVSPTIHSGVI